MKEENEIERLNVGIGDAVEGEHCFYLDFTGLTAEVSEDGKTIAFFVNGSRYPFAAPFADGIGGYTVTYALTPLENGVCLLVATVCRNRILTEERELSVTVRPPV